MIVDAAHAGPDLTTRSPGLDRRGFRLCKWYMDVVSPEGHAAIAYWADLRWGVLRFAYSGILEAHPGSGVESRSTARRGDPPVLDNQGASWAAPRLGIRGRWDRAAAPIERTLLTGADGQVEWSCALPRARAVLTTPTGTIQGWGYAERLTLSIRPWRLPIDELRWGRFQGDEASLIWIQWRGPQPRLVLLHDGRETADALIGEDAIAWRGGRLSLSAPRTLRRGALGSTVLIRRRCLRAITPRAILALHEDKSLSRGELMVSGRRPMIGWAIHEVVTFRSRP